MSARNGVSSAPSHLPIPAFDPPRKPKRNKYALACSFLASMTSILLGYDIGVMSGAIIYIRKTIHMTDVQKEVIMGILNLYSLLGSAAAGRTSDWIGRRYTIIFAGGIFFAGALLMGFATSYAFLMVGRFVAGIGVGYALMIAPVYTAEVAPASTRGFLTSFPEVFINFGILLGYVSNYAFSKLPTNLGWRFMLGIGAVPSVFIAIAVLAMPESPRWLVMQGRLGEARTVLEKTSDSPEESKLRLTEIKEAAGIPEHCNDDIVAVPKQHHGEGVWRELLLRPTPAVRHILMIYEDGLYFGSHVLIGQDRKAAVAFIQCGGMIVSLVGLGIGLTIVEKSDHKMIWAVALCISTVLSFVAFFSIGMGPITWVYSSEIFPLRLRAQGCSMGVAMNRVTSGVISMTFISLYDAISIGGVFFLYAGIAAVAWVFFYTFLPETQGKTLEEMETLFGTFYKWRSTLRALNEKKRENDRQVQMGNTTTKEHNQS
ncbi:UNVERIFIED_CONTAM: Polyol transporter 5 [Sesamum calycinum]|uniref:Polyol transporter 5 n=1 Tax=Sesamum calycinum TaxID=2727403 RepID=A0AAW2PLQ1_9LAMI